MHRHPPSPAHPNVSSSSAPGHGCCLPYCDSSSNLQSSLTNWMACRQLAEVDCDPLAMHLTHLLLRHTHRIPRWSDRAISLQVTSTCFIFCGAPRFSPQSPLSSLGIALFISSIQTSSSPPDDSAVHSHLVIPYLSILSCAVGSTVLS